MFRVYNQVCSITVNNPVLTLLTQRDDQNTVHYGLVFLYWTKEQMFLSSWTQELVELGWRQQDWGFDSRFCWVLVGSTVLYQVCEPVSVCIQYKEQIQVIFFFIWVRTTFCNLLKHKALNQSQVHLKERVYSTIHQTANLRTYRPDKHLGLAILNLTYPWTVDVCGRFKSSLFKSHPLSLEQIKQGQIKAG